MTEALSSPRKTSRGWRIVRVAAKILAGAIAVLFAVWVVDIIWSNFFTDEAFREAQYQAGMEKVLIYEFRDHFHGRERYKPASLLELRKEGVLSEDTYEFITSGSYRYIPFSPSTPDDALVLRLGLPFLGDKFHKGDFTADQQAADIVITK